MAHEIMIMNSAMRNQIREKKTNQLKSALMLARKDGCKRYNKRTLFRMRKLYLVFSDKKMTTLLTQ